MYIICQLSGAVECKIDLDWLILTFMCIDSVNAPFDLNLLLKNYKILWRIDVEVMNPLRVYDTSIIDGECSIKQLSVSYNF